MDDIRAKTIASSPVLANVTFHGSRVYIERVNEKTGTAQIHLLDHPEAKQEVPLVNLIEH